MPQRTDEQSRKDAELEWLIDEIECGTIEDVDELDDADVKLLREAYVETDSLQDLLDLLRQENR
jgi:hypothetical protein